MTTPIPVRQRREVLPDEGERWLRGEGDHDSVWVFLEPDLPAVWCAHRARIVSEHVEQWPGTRPRRWWAFDAPSPRVRLGGVGDRLSACTVHAERYEFGLPAEGFRRVGDDFDGRGVPVDPRNPPAYESEATYLARHKLFLPGERERLRPCDFWRELVEP